MNDSPIDPAVPDQDSDSSEQEPISPKAAKDSLTKQLDKTKQKLLTPDAISLAVYYFAQAKHVLTNPHQFFEQMPEKGGLMEPVIFLATSATIYGLLEAIGRFNLMVLITSFFSSFFFAFLSAAVVNHALRWFGGKGTFESTFRVIAFSKATLLFAWIAAGSIQIGGFLSLAYAVYLNVVGAKKVHQLKTVKTAAVIVLWTLLQFLIKKVTHL